MPFRFRLKPLHPDHPAWSTSCHKEPVEVCAADEEEAKAKAAETYGIFVEGASPTTYISPWRDLVECERVDEEDED